MCRYSLLTLVAGSPEAFLEADSAVPAAVQSVDKHAPAPRVYVPGGQDVQLSFFIIPMPVWYVPEGQSTHSIPDPRYWPGKQSGISLIFEV